jgi:hypothetical protein
MINIIRKLSIDLLSGFWNNFDKKKWPKRYIGNMIDDKQYLGLYFKFDLYRTLFHSGFSLDRFHYKQNTKNSWHKSTNISLFYHIKSIIILFLGHFYLKLCQKPLKDRFQFFFFCHFKISFYTAVFPYIVAILEIFKNKKIVYCEIVDLLSNVFVFILLSFFTNTVKTVSLSLSCINVTCMIYSQPYPYS